MKNNRSFALNFDYLPHIINGFILCVDVLFPNTGSKSKIKIEFSLFTYMP